MTATPNGADEPQRGIYDCDEAHRSPVEADYEQLFRSGMVVLDTNVLLNLYRSNERTRQDTLAALDKLRDRLWIPHQVLTEFWRNRELSSVRHHHATKAKEACAALDKAIRSASDALSRWRTAVHLTNDDEVSKRIKGGLETFTATKLELQQFIEDQAAKDALAETSTTHTDPVLTALDPLLHGRIGEPLSASAFDKAVQEAQERADEGIPPGHEDFRSKPPELAAGDYLLWVQTLGEAKRRRCDVLLVTGDVKKDWWVTRDGDIPPRPRSELVVELREHAAVRLFMLTPDTLLTLAKKLLKVEVDESSVRDLAQLGDAQIEEESSDDCWTLDALQSFFDRLQERYPSRVGAIIAAAAAGGFVSRATIYRLAGYPEERQLRGYTRPISTVTKELQDAGVLTGKEPFLLHAVYGSSTEPSLATGFRIPDEVIPLVREGFGHTELWRNATGADPDDGDPGEEPGTA